MHDFERASSFFSSGSRVGVFIDKFAFINVLRRSSSSFGDSHSRNSQDEPSHSLFDGKNERFGCFSQENSAIYKIIKAFVDGISYLPTQCKK